MAKTEDKTVPSEPTVEETILSETNSDSAVEEVTEQGKRGRNPLTHADVMTRLSTPNPVDVSFAEFAESKFAAITLAGNNVERAFVLGALLGRWSTVVKWWNESDEQKSAKEKVLAWQAEQELAAKVAKLTPIEKAEFDAAPESVKAMILRFIAI